MLVRNRKQDTTISHEIWTGGLSVSSLSIPKRLATNLTALWLAVLYLLQGVDKFLIAVPFYCMFRISGTVAARNARRLTVWANKRSDGFSKDVSLAYIVSSYF